MGLMGDKSYYGAVYQAGPYSSDCCNNNTSALTFATLASVTRSSHSLENTNTQFRETQTDTAQASKSTHTGKEKLLAKILFTLMELIDLMQ